MGAAAAATAGSSHIMPAAAQPRARPRASFPDTPIKIGHMTFLTGPAAVLGEPSLKGHILAAEEINAAGGILGKRKIETITADENAGTDANVKEMRRMKLSEKIDVFTGIISSGNTPALGPVAEELGLLTIFVDGCTDFLFDKAVPNPKYTFRITNIQSADGVTCAVAAAQTWPTAKKIAHIHPDYSYGRNAFDHFMVAYKKLVPGAEVVSKAWPKLGTTDFTAHITKTISSSPDLIVSSVWGGDYVAMYKQALRYGMFNRRQVRQHASPSAWRRTPSARTTPRACIAGVHSNYYFTFPAGTAGPPTRPSSRSTSSAGTSIRTSSRTAPTTRSTCTRRDREGEQAGRRLAGRGSRHRHARRHVFRDGRGLSLHPARQPPGLQGRGDRLQQERARVSVPDPGPEPDDHHPDPQHHGASELAEARQRPQRPDRDVQLDQGNLAAGQPDQSIGRVSSTAMPVARAQASAVSQLQALEHETGSAWHE